MENLTIGEVKKTPKKQPRGGYKEMSPFSKTLKKRLKKLKPGTCFEVIGVSSQGEANNVRSRLCGINKKLNLDYSTTLSGDVLTIMRAKKSK